LCVDDERRMFFPTIYPCWLFLVEWLSCSFLLLNTSVYCSSFLSAISSIPSAFGWHFILCDFNHNILIYIGLCFSTLMTMFFLYMDCTFHSTWMLVLIYIWIAFFFHWKDGKDMPWITTKTYLECLHLSTLDNNEFNTRKPLCLLCLNGGTLWCILGAFLLPAF